MCQMKSYLNFIFIFLKNIAYYVYNMEGDVLFSGRRCCVWVGSGLGVFLCVLAVLISCGCASVFLGWFCWVAVLCFVLFCFTLVSFCVACSVCGRLGLVPLLWLIAISMLKKVVKYH